MLQQNREDRAILEQAGTAGPDPITLARLYSRMAAFQEAASRYRTILTSAGTLDPEDQERLQQAREQLAQDDSDERDVRPRLITLRQIVTERPNLAGPHLELAAILFFRIGDLEGGLAELEVLIRTKAIEARNPRLIETVHELRTYRDELLVHHRIPEQPDLAPFGILISNMGKGEPPL